MGGCPEILLEKRDFGMILLEKHLLREIWIGFYWKNNQNLIIFRSAMGWDWRKSAQNQTGTPQFFLAALRAAILINITCLRRNRYFVIEILSRELHERGSQHEPNPINFSVSPEKYQDINNSLSPLLTDLTAPPSPFVSEPGSGINTVFMDYTPPYYRPKFWTRKIEIFKRAEKLKNGVLGPPQAEFFWVQNPLWTIPPLLSTNF